MLAKLVSQVVVAILALFLATKFVAGVSFVGSLITLGFIGLILGAIHFFLKPFLKKLSWPLRILTLGLFNFVINMAILWFVDSLFAELTISGLKPLFLTSLIISLLGIFIPSK